MTKRLVEIDDRLLEQARAAAGTATIKATVEVALAGLVNHDMALRHVARLRMKGALDLTVIQEARSARTDPHG